MSGLQFWGLVFLILASAPTAYVIGYRVGWTDGVASVRKWADK